MAATSAIVLGVGTAAYGAIDANQQRQKAKGVLGAQLRERQQVDAATSQMTANRAMLDAQQKQRDKVNALGKQNSTILTTPQGVNAAPPATKTLLGA